MLVMLNKVKHLILCSPFSDPSLKLRMTDHACHAEQSEASDLFVSPLQILR